MINKSNKDTFETVRRYVKISFFISSLIPLSLLTYISFKYVYPHIEMPFYFVVLLSLAVIISVLGLFLLTKTTNSSICSLKDIYEKLNSIIEITKHFRTTIFLDILLKDIVQSAMNLTGAETASLLLYDEKDNLRFQVLLGEKGQKLKDRFVKSGEGFAGWVAETGQSLLINEAEKDKRYNPEFDSKAGFKTRSVLCAPLIHNDKVIGVIEILNKKTGVFTYDDEKLLRILADQASLSIAQSRLYEKQKSDNIHITEIFVKAQDSHSPEKKGHVRRVAKYAHLIGKQMGLSESDLKNLYHASLFHDVGFLLIETCETGESKSWSKERYIRHPQLGYDMIKPISLWEEAAPIIQQHHERYDGTGYPLKKKGEDILPAARILFVAEVFDVLTSKSSYKERLNFNEAISEIEANSGAQFDPAVVEAFKKAVKDSDLID